MNLLYFPKLSCRSLLLGGRFFVEKFFCIFLGRTYDFVFFENKLKSYGRLEVPKLSSWTQLKNLVKQQTKLMRIAWGVGIGSTLVVTAYTLQESFKCR